MFLQRRKNRPMFFIDIAVPRDVDAELNKLDGIFVYDIDDLQQVMQANLQDRSLEASRAEEIIVGEIRRYEARVQGREAVPTIVSLQQHVEGIRRAELERARGKLGMLTPEQEMAVEALTRAIVNKVLHPSLIGLKQDAKTFGEMVKRVFGISSADEQPPENETQPEMTQSIGSGTKRQS